MYSSTTLVGRLGKDPEFKEFSSSNKASFSLATDYSFKNKSGDYTSKTEWHNCIVWGPQAKSVAQYLKKGSLVLVEGRIETESWDDKTSGEKKYKTTIVANTVKFLDKKEKSEAELVGAAKIGRAVSSADPIADEDIPF